AMELLLGLDLGELLERDEKVEPVRMLRLFKRVLGAIHKGHESGVVHKDLKPSNLFLSDPDTEHERLVVLDYGIARLFDDPDSRLTRTGGVSGTPLYLTPEYINEQIAVPQTDVYQLALILVEALTGVVPAAGDSPLCLIANHTLCKLEIPGTVRRSPLGRI